MRSTLRLPVTAFVTALPVALALTLAGACACSRMGKDASDVLDRPSVTLSTPANGATNVDRDAFVSTEVRLVTAGAGVDAKTLPGGVRLTRVRDTRRLASWMWDQAQLGIAPGEFFGAAGHIRIGYGRNGDDLASGLERFAAALRSYTEDY